MNSYFKKVKSPIGDLYIAASDKGLEAIIYPKNWAKYKARNLGMVEGTHKVIEQTAKQLAEYWQGKRRDFDIPLHMKGTDFQIKAWRALTKIPFGKTKTYKEQAVAIKSDKAVRAVGSANGKNPISIVVPCHRVIGSNEKLTGYAGGLSVKEFLLNLEEAKFSK